MGADNKLDWSERKWVIFFEGETASACAACHSKREDVYFYRIKDPVTLCKRCYVEWYEKN